MLFKISGQNLHMNVDESLGQEMTSNVLWPIWNNRILDARYAPIHWTNISIYRDIEQNDKSVKSVQTMIDE